MISAVSDGVSRTNTGGREYAAEVAKLRLQVEELQAELLYYKERDAGLAAIYPADWGLTSKESILLNALASAGRVHSKDSLIDRMYGVDADQPEQKIIDVFICKIRKKLRYQGIAILTTWGRGYYLTEEGRRVCLEARTAAANGTFYKSPLEALGPKVETRGKSPDRCDLPDYTQDLLRTRGRAFRVRRTLARASQKDVAVEAAFRHYTVVGKVENGEALASMLVRAEEALTRLVGRSA